MPGVFSRRPKVKNLRKWKTQLSLISCLVLVCSIPAGGNSGSGSQDPVHAEVQASGAGIVVEKVEERSEAEKEGFQKGDVLLTWTNPWKHGAFTSPFDAYWLDALEMPLAPMTINGTRSGKPKTWQSHSFYNGAEYRPNFEPAILAGYRSGQKLEAAGKLEEAASQWAELAARSDAKPAWQGTWLLHQSATLLNKARKWDKADGLYAETLRSAQSAPFIRRELLHFLALSYMWRGEHDVAIKYFQEMGPPDVQALELAEPPGLRTVDTSRGLLCPISRGESTESLSPVSFRFRPSLLAGRELWLLGKLHEARGELEKADQYFEQARLEYRQMGAEDVNALLSIADIAYRRADLRKAAQYYRQVLTTCRQGLGHSLTGLGNVADSQGDTVRAHHYYILGLQQFRQGTDRKEVNMAVLLGNLGLVAHNEGRYQTAQRYYQKECAILHRIWPESIYMADCFTQLGNNARSRGRLAEAEKYFRASMQLMQKKQPGGFDHAYVLNDLGGLLLERGKLDEAEQLFHRALEIRARFVPGSKHESEVLASLGKVMRRKQKLEAAEDFYKRALDALDSQMSRLAGDTGTRARFRANRDNYYREYADLLITLGKPELAYTVLERARGRLNIVTVRDML